MVFDKLKPPPKPEAFAPMIEGMLDQVAALRPVLERSGFALAAIELTASAPPSMEIALAPADDAADLVAAEIARGAAPKAAMSLLKTLQGVHGAAAKAAERSGFRVAAIAVVMSAPPEVRVELEAR